MPTISDAVRDIVQNNPTFQFGLHHRLLNLSQVARFIHPMVEARTMKEVTTAAITMSLSRLQKRLEGEQPAATREFYIDRINIHGGLCSLTLQKSAQTFKELNTLFNRIQEQGGYITVTEGTREITTIIEQKNLDLIRSILTRPPRHVHRHLAGVGVSFPEPYLTTPGFLYQLLQQVALQNINVVEVASTTTEFNIYVDDDDVMTAFDSIYNRFSRERRT